MPFPYVNRVLIKRESGQGDPDAHALTGAASDLRAVLEELLAAVNRGESGGEHTGFHAVIVGDGSSRYEFSHIAVRVDADIQKHRQGVRGLWRFYDAATVRGDDLRWVCQTCGENIDSQFSECWRCTQLPREANGVQGRGSDWPQRPSVQSVAWGVWLAMAIMAFWMLWAYTTPSVER